MRLLSGAAFALSALVLSSLNAQTAASQAAPPQTARQALIEMFFGQAPNHLEKHLPEVTRQAFQDLESADGQSVLGTFASLAKQAQQGNEKVETFDTGSVIFAITDIADGNHNKTDVTVESDTLSGDEDQIELALHLTRDGKEEAIPLIPHFTFVMKMESGVWRLNEVGASVRVSLADPAFLKSLLQRQREQNEQMALMSMRLVISAENSYQSAQGGFACALSALGKTGKEPGHHFYLYDTQLMSGKKNGYVFAISACDASHYQLVAEPSVADWGQRAYCSDESGTVRSSSDGKAATCLVGGQVVEQKDPITLQAAPSTMGASPAPQNNYNSGAAVPGQRVRVSQGVVQGLIVSKVQPTYPDLARAARIQGNVLMKATISAAGDVVSLELISGHPMLAPAAMDAVKQWKYKPYLLNGKAMAVETQIMVNFALTGD